MCVPARAAGWNIWTRGSCCDSPRLRRASHCRFPALISTNFILGKLLFFSPPPPPPPPQQIKCSSRRKTEAKGKERSSKSDVCSPGGSLLFTLQEVDFRYFLILLAPLLGQTEPFGSARLFSKKKKKTTSKSASEESTVEKFCTVTRHGILLCTLESSVPSGTGVLGPQTPVRRSGHPALAA